ncbi:MAG: hypothetical protein R3C11_14785 [Planctomycetaceae bacterium]
MPFWPFKRKTVETLPVESLQYYLINNALTLNDAKFIRFCKDYKSQIEDHVESLRKVSEELRGSPEGEQNYVQGLMRAGMVLNQYCASDKLWNAITGPRDSNDPTSKLQACLNQIPSRIEQGEHDEVIKELQQWYIEMEKLRGTLPEYYKAVIQGQIGAVAYGCGNLKSAESSFAKALELCRANVDSDGVMSYLGNLVGVKVYNNELSDALVYGEELLNLYQSTDDPRLNEFSYKLEHMKNGNPSLVMMCRCGNKIMKPEEVIPQEVTGIHFEFVRAYTPMGKAEQLLEVANQYASTGKAEQALELSVEAAGIDPRNPEPLYLQALLLLEAQEYTRARETYEKVEELAPGWFETRFDLWLATQLEIARYTHEVFDLWRKLMDGGLHGVNLLRLAEKATTQYPEFAPYWLKHGEAQEELGQSQKAMVAYRHGLELCEEPHTESLLLVRLAGILSPTSPERRELLDRCISLEGSLFAQATAKVLKNFS